MVAELTRSNDTEQAEPSEQAYLAQSSDAGEHKTNNGGHDHKYCSACAMGGYGVQANGKTEHTRAGRENPV